MSIFRAYDIRGIVPSRQEIGEDALTPAIVEQIGQAIGSEAAASGQQKVVVARDGRLSGPALIEALIKGLQATGRDVINIGMVPTPVLYFATYHLNTGSGVMLTGSHNPPNYNGLKIMIGGEALSGDRIQALKTRLEKGDLITNTGTGTLEIIDISDAYIKRITDDVKLARPFKVVVDCGNGVAGALAPKLIKALGCEVIELFCEVDGHFPNHHPDPSMPENLEDMIKAVEGADLALAFDGDGDRLGVVDSKGKIIWPDRQMILYTTDLLKRHPGAEIIYDVKCTRHLRDAIQQQGGKPKMWKTGHSLIKSEMKKSGALLGGEMSGHIFFKERWYGFDDALYTAARLLEILSKDSRPPEKIFAALPDAVNTPELKLEMAEFGEHYELMDKIRDRFRFEGAEVATVDGIRADFKDGWGLVRPSNTTPCLVIRFEGDNQAALDAIADQFRRQFLAIDSTLKLPF